MKTALKNGTKITLTDSITSKKMIFTIEDIIGTGASCFVYTASYFTSGYQKQLEFRMNPSHMNSISNIQGVYTGNNTKYIAMTCNNGFCISADNDFSFTDIIRVICAVTKQICIFHENGYLYLDLKPNNIFLYPESPDMIMLFDFDSVISKKDVRKHSEWLSYTADWSAPELSRNQIDKIDERADIYSIGALLLFLLFRRKPSLADKRRFASWDDDIDQSILSSESPENIRLVTDILKKTLCTNVDNRFESCYDILDIIKPYLEKLLSPKPYLKTYIPMGNNFFCGREVEIAEIHEKIQNNTLIALHGIGGIGKSELAKHYALEYSENYDAVIFIRYNKSIRDTIISDTNFPIVNCRQSEDENDDNYFERKLHILNSICSSRHLIILDNFDTDECDDIEYLTGLQCKIIVTSRVDYSDVFEQIEVDVLDTTENMYKLVTHYYQYKTDEKNDEAIYHIISAVEGHTMALELIAKHMHNMEIQPVEMRELLTESGIASGDKGNVRTIKDGKLKSNTAYAHISILFSIFGLSEEIKQGLRYFALLGPYIIDEETYFDFVDISDEEENVLVKLISCGWIQYFNNDNNSSFTMHPLICDVLCNELKPDIENCEEFILNAAEIADSIGSYNKNERELRLLCLNHTAHNIYGNSTVITWLLHNMSTMYMYETDYESAKWCNKKIIEVLTFLGMKDKFSTEILNSYLFLIHLDSLLGIDDTKEYYYNKIKEIGTPLSMMYLFEIQCDEALANNDYDTAIEYSKLRLNIALELNDDECISRAYSQLGLVEKDFCHLDSAESYYLKAIEYFNIFIKNKSERANSDTAGYYRYLGNIKSYIKDYSGAIDAFHQAILLFDSDYGEGNIKSGNIYSSLSEIYLKINDKKKLLECQKKAVLAYERVFGRYHDETIEVYEEIYYTYMQIWENTKDTDLLNYAIDTLNILIDSYKETDGEDSSNIITCYMKYADVSKLLCKKEECKIYTEKVVTAIETNPNINDELQMHYHFNAAENYVFIGSMDKAMKEFEKSLIICRNIGDTWMLNYIQENLNEIK